MEAKDPFLRWRLAQAENARTLAAIAETCGRIAESQATLARALAQTRERLRGRTAGHGTPGSLPAEGSTA